LNAPSDSVLSDFSLYAMPADSQTNSQYLWPKYTAVIMLFIYDTETAAPTVYYFVSREMFFEV
jgi:hypothetical protein